MHRLTRLRRDETGVTYVFIGLSMMTLLSASMLAIDVGMLMTARNQAQNSADAGALAGATALVYDNFTDHSSTGPAVTNALNAARANEVMRGVVSVNPADVEFLVGTGGEENRVRVSVYRRTSRGNPLSTLIARYFGTATADIAAVATAEASPANAITCPLPFTIPDRWIERQTPPWDPDDTFDLFDSKSKPLANPDIYIPATEGSYTGYDAERDKGLQVVLKADNTSKINPSIYYPWAPPGRSGADDYREAIAGCIPSVIMPFGAMLTPEPGSMVGPTAQGIRDRIDQDPSAYWDTAQNKVVSNMHPSPRVAAIPLFDPDFYENGKHGGKNADLRAVNYLGFFIEGMRGNEVVGRVTPIGGLRMGTGYGPAPIGAFPLSIRLVQ